MVVGLSTGFGLSACTRGYAYSTATRSEEVGVRIMAHRVVAGKKPANKIGGLNIGEIAALRSQDMQKSAWAKSTTLPEKMVDTGGGRRNVISPLQGLKKILGTLYPDSYVFTSKYWIR